MIEKMGEAGGANFIDVLSVKSFKQTVLAKSLSEEFNSGNSYN
jgi:hypothetical protein